MENIQMPMPGGTQNPESQGNTATPEEEQLMGQALEEAGKIIYQNDKANDAILSSIQKARQPSAGIGQATAQVVETVDRKMDLPEDFIIPLGEGVLPLIVEMADAAGIVEASDEIVEQATGVMVKTLASMYDATPEDAQELVKGAPMDQVKEIGQRMAGVMTDGQQVQ